MKEESSCAEDFAIISKYSDMVYKLAYSLVKNKYDAEDIHQEVFIRFLCKRPQFQNADHEKAWFLRVTVNLSKNMWRTAWKRKIISIHDYNAMETAEVNRAESSIIDTVKQLPPKYRAIIHLFYYEELSVKEIADILKLRPSAVKTRLSRARKKLKELLGG